MMCRSARSVTSGRPENVWVTEVEGECEEQDETRSWSLRAGPYDERRCFPTTSRERIAGAGARPCFRSHVSSELYWRV